MPKIGEFGEKSGRYSMRKWLDYNHFRVSLFFCYFFLRAEDCAEGCAEG